MPYLALQALVIENPSGCDCHPDIPDQGLEGNRVYFQLQCNGNPVVAVEHGIVFSVLLGRDDSLADGKGLQKPFFLDLHAGFLDLEGHPPAIGRENGRTAVDKFLFFRRERNIVFLDTQLLRDNLLPDFCARSCCVE